MGEEAFSFLPPCVLWGLVCSLSYSNEDVHDATSVKCLVHFTQALKFSEVIKWSPLTMKESDSQVLKKA